MYGNGYFSHKRSYRTPRLFKSGGAVFTKQILQGRLALLCCLAQDVEHLPLLHLGTRQAVLDGPLKNRKVQRVCSSRNIFQYPGRYGQRLVPFLVPKIDSPLLVRWGWLFLPGLRMRCGCRLQLFVACYSPACTIKKSNWQKFLPVQSVLIGQSRC